MDVSLTLAQPYGTTVAQATLTARRALSSVPGDGWLRKKQRETGGEQSGGSHLAHADGLNS